MAWNGKPFLTPDQVARLTEARDALNECMLWKNTPQGNKFWQIVSRELENLIDNGEMYHIDTPEGDAIPFEDESETVRGGTGINPFTGLMTVPGVTNNCVTNGGNKDGDVEECE